MDALTENTDKDLQHLIGTKVQVTDNKGKTITGTLQFAGINEFTKHFQVTIDRMPIWPINKNTIKSLTTE